MPQLNPSPWFIILVFSWMVFLIVAPTKVMGHKFNNEPTTQATQTTTTNPWNWPWH
uniref:ATP synthase complex subunit 8 n=1 Tax=Gymnomuraena zebra TaxID=876649 RepID=A0A0U2C1I7_9TELE|nr:ATP synthase F0 subunit 8 [Gymnomuraena zebra]AKI32568.1 ATP synthase F0 subunit 8 [Gymnomuraena zebra]WNH38137.1 ATP synthase F0 subunit 8 [Gymnomuraena zebra]